MAPGLYGEPGLDRPDQGAGWQPPADLGHLDLAVVPIGIIEINPLSGERNLPADQPVLQTEATFRQTLDIVRQLDADRVLMTHIEEPDRLSYDDLEALAAKLASDGLNIAFAYDGLIVEV